jgi:hypothetical protein
VNVCGRCGDDFDEHVMVATSGDPMDGGIVLCPNRGCPCYSTWSPHYAGQESHTPKVIPNSHELAAMRERIWDDPS